MKVQLILLFLLSPLYFLAQAPTTVQEAATGVLAFNESRVVALAEAIPEDKYTWRPDEGVRSVAESLMHIAAANYFFFITAGQAPPADVDPMTMEKSITGKTEIIEALKKSYEYARNGVQAISESEFGDKVEFPFPGEFNKLSTIMIAAGHCEEHMGQLVAYARMNGITPPWSEGQ